MAERFDVIYDKNGCYLDYHFCREFDDEGGCYGTRDDHGFSFDEAREHIVDWYKQQVEKWKSATLEDFKNHKL